MARTDQFRASHRCARARAVHDEPGAARGLRLPAGARGKTLAYIDQALHGRQWLTESYSVADIYLAVVISWLQSPKIKEANKPVLLVEYPNIEAHQKRVLARPAAARALAEELEMLRAAL